MKRFLIFLVIAVFAVSMLFFGVSCKKAAEEVAETEEQAGPKYGGTLVIAANSEPQHLDQGLVGWANTHFIADSINGYLITQNFDSEIVGMLAKDWEIVDDLTIRIELKQGILFHNGREVVAKDVQESLDRSLHHPETTRKGLLGGIDGVEVIDDYNFIIHQNRTNPDIIPLLSLAPIIPSEELDEDGLMKDNPVGCGPFKFVSWDRGAKVVLERFDGYFEVDEDGNSLPYLDRLEFVFPGDPAAKLSGLMSGEIDMIQNASMADVKASLEGELEGIKSDTGGMMDCSAHFIMFNLREDMWDNLPLRQAISYAIDREELMELAWYGLNEPNNSFVSRKFRLYNPEWEKYAIYDPKMAKQKLEEAGYPDGIEIDFKLYAEEPWKTEGEILKEQFAEVGITANLTTVEQTSYHDVVLKQYDYELGQAGGGYVPVPGTVLNMYLHSSGFANYGGLSDPAMDALIEEFRVTWDEDRQYELYDEIMTYTMKNVKPFIILCPHKASFFLMKDKVMGWKGQLNADFIFSHVWLAE